MSEHGRRSKGTAEDDPFLEYEVAVRAQLARLRDGENICHQVVERKALVA